MLPEKRCPFSCCRNTIYIGGLHVGDVRITQLHWTRVPQARSRGCKSSVAQTTECSRHYASRPTDRDFLAHPVVPEMSRTDRHTDMCSSRYSSHTRTGHGTEESRENTEYNVIYVSSQIVFTARCYASAVLAMALCPSVCLSVRLSVRPSQVGVLLKRLNVGSRKQHHTIAQGL